MIKYFSSHRILCLMIGILALISVSCESEKREQVDIGDLPDPMSFSEHIVPIFEQKCNQCHNGTPPVLTPNEAYLNLVGGGFINVEDPAGSKLYEAIDLGGSMYQYASDLDRAYILKWIEDGAEDN